VTRIYTGVAILVGALLGPVTSHAQSAYSYRWCALYGDRSGAQSCYFQTRRQCEETLSGIGGSCIRSPYHRGD
jgi:Protein of unknown function (DUF3551)